MSEPYLSALKAPRLSRASGTTQPCHHHPSVNEYQEASRYANHR
jgi:hypothetical protein